MYRLKWRPVGAMIKCGGLDKTDSPTLLKIINCVLMSVFYKSITACSLSVITLGSDDLLRTGIQAHWEDVREQTIILLLQTYIKHNNSFSLICLTTTLNFLMPTLFY